MSDQLQKYTLADSFNRCQFFFKIKQIFEEMKLIVGTRDGGVGRVKCLQRHVDQFVVLFK